MRILYLDRKGVHLSVESGSLACRSEGQPVQRIPLRMIDQICALQSITTTTGTLARLAEAGISVVMFAGRKSENRAFLAALPANDPARRLHQYQARLDETRRCAIVRDLLALKLRAQYRLLLRWLRQRPDARLHLLGAAWRIHRLYPRLMEAKAGVETLRGVEGSASEAVFSALRQIVPEELGFAGRKRRPPPDPVNALLSLGYTLATGIVQQEVVAVGLDPAIGYLHDPVHGRESLALDLVEPLRPRIEWMVWQILRARTLDERHFYRRDGACLLSKEGRSRFYPLWSAWAEEHRRHARKLCHALVARLENTGEQAS